MAGAAAVINDDSMVTKAMTLAALSRSCRSRAMTRANISPAQPPTACKDRPAARASMEGARVQSSGAKM